VFILAHCRNPELFGATRLVFDTIRTGFPNAELIVFESGNRIDLADQIWANAEKVGARVISSQKAIEHPDFIEGVMSNRFGYCGSDSPFVLCDTDMIFWDNVEKSIEGFSQSDYPLYGRYIPKFYDEFTKCITMPRLHTSLLCVNPPRLRDAVRRYEMEFPQTVYNPLTNLFRPLVVPMGEYSTFFDGGALLYNAIGGQAFDENMLNRYDHLHCGTISDIVAPHLTLGRYMTENNLNLIANPSAARGIWRQQSEYYEKFTITN
jgi:hypothetical protein